MVMENDLPPQELEPRQPTLEDLRDLCHELNQRGARYLVIGGFAMMAANYNRTTMDIDLMVATDLENEKKVFSALSTLPDNAVRELQPGELREHQVIRISDEFVVDLLGSAGGLSYEEAARQTSVHDIDGVLIPFASPQLLWRLKSVTHREKDLVDLVYLRHWFESRGLDLPER